MAIAKHCNMRPSDVGQGPQCTSQKFNSSATAADPQCTDVPDLSKIRQSAVELFQNSNLYPLGLVLGLRFTESKQI